jgi:hypothetical protein
MSKARVIKKTGGPEVGDLSANCAFSVGRSASATRMGAGSAAIIGGWISSCGGVNIALAAGVNSRSQHPSVCSSGAVGTFRSAQSVISIPVYRHTKRVRATTGAAASDASTIAEITRRSTKPA